MDQRSSEWTLIEKKTFFQKVFPVAKKSCHNGDAIDSLCLIIHAVSGVTDPLEKSLSDLLKQTD
jgi:hypothetical protein